MSKTVISNSQAVAISRNLSEQKNLSSKLDVLDQYAFHSRDAIHQDLKTWRKFRRENVKNSGWSPRSLRPEPGEDIFLMSTGRSSSPNSPTQTKDTFTKPWAYSYSQSSHNKVYKELVQVSKNAQKSLDITLNKANSLDSPSDKTNRDQQPAMLKQVDAFRGLNRAALVLKSKDRLLALRQRNEQSSVETESVEKTQKGKFVSAVTKFQRVKQFGEVEKTHIEEINPPAIPVQHPTSKLLKSVSAIKGLMKSKEIFICSKCGGTPDESDESEKKDQFSKIALAYKGLQRAKTALKLTYPLLDQDKTETPETESVKPKARQCCCHCSVKRESISAIWKEPKVKSSKKPSRKEVVSVKNKKITPKSQNKPSQTLPQSSILNQNETKRRKILEAKQKVSKCFEMMLKDDNDVPSPASACDKNNDVTDWSNGDSAVDDDSIQDSRMNYNTSKEDGNESEIIADEVTTSSNEQLLRAEVNNKGLNSGSVGIELEIQGKDNKQKCTTVEASNYAGKRKEKALVSNIDEEKIENQSKFPLEKSVAVEMKPKINNNRTKLSQNRNRRFGVTSPSSTQLGSLCESQSGKGNNANHTAVDKIPACNPFKKLASYNKRDPRNQDSFSEKGKSCDQITTKGANKMLSTKTKSMSSIGEGCDKNDENNCVGPSTSSEKINVYGTIKEEGDATRDTEFPDILEEDDTPGDIEHQVVMKVLQEEVFNKLKKLPKQQSTPSLRRLSTLSRASSVFRANSRKKKGTKNIGVNVFTKIAKYMLFRLWERRKEKADKMENQGESTSGYESTSCSDMAIRANKHESWADKQLQQQQQQQQQKQQQHSQNQSRGMTSNDGEITPDDKIHLNRVTTRLARAVTDNGGSAGLNDSRHGEDELEGICGSRCEENTPALSIHPSRQIVSRKGTTLHCQSNHEIDNSNKSHYKHSLNYENNDKNDNVLPSTNNASRQQEGKAARNANVNLNDSRSIKTSYVSVVNQTVENNSDECHRLAGRNYVSHENDNLNNNNSNDNSNHNFSNNNNNNNNNNTPDQESIYQNSNQPTTTSVFNFKSSKDQEEGSEKQQKQSGLVLKPPVYHRGVRLFNYVSPEKRHLVSAREKNRKNLSVSWHSAVGAMVNKHEVCQAPLQAETTFPRHARYRKLQEMVEANHRPAPDDSWKLHDDALNARIKVFLESVKPFKQTSG